MAKFRTTFGKVKELLMSDIKYQDSDEKLVVRIWYDELDAMGYDSKVITTVEFFRIYIAGKLTTADIITRARRKCNEEYPFTRGRSYNGRMKNQKEIISQVKELSNINGKN